MNISKKRIFETIRLCVMLSVVPITFLPYNPIGIMLRISIVTWMIVDLFYIRPKYSGKNYMKNAISTILLFVFMIAMVVFLIHIVSPNKLLELTQVIKDNFLK